MDISELISDSSSDDGEVIVHRPVNRRGSSRIVDERIEDESSDDDVQINEEPDVPALPSFSLNFSNRKDHVFEIKEDAPITTKVAALNDSYSAADLRTRTEERSIGPFSSANEKYSTALDVEAQLPSTTTPVIPGVILRPVAAELASEKVSPNEPITAVVLVAVPSSSVPLICREEKKLPMAAAVKALAAVKVKVSKIVPQIAVKAERTTPLVAVKSVLSVAVEVTAAAAASVISIRARSGSVDHTLEKSSRKHDIHSSINSGTSSNIKSSIVSSSGSSNSHEGKDRSKDRLWPSRALIAFCRYTHEIY